MKETKRAKPQKRQASPRWSPQKNRKDKREYDKEVYKQRNEIERLFRRLKRYRRVFTRYDTLDAMYTEFITLALIHETLHKA